MVIQWVAVIAQIAVYVLGALTVSMGVAALIWMFGRGARRRTLRLLLLDVIALSLILGPVLLGRLGAGSLAGWGPVFQIPGFALVLVRVVLAYAELRVAWPGLAARTRAVPAGLYRMLRWSLRTALFGAACALFAAFAAAISGPYETFHFSAGAIPMEKDNCTRTRSGGRYDAGDVTCLPSATWRLPAGGSIESRALDPARNPMSILDTVSYKAGVRVACAATVRWAGYVNGVKVVGGVVRHDEAARPFVIPVDPRIREFRVTATRTDKAPCAAEFVLLAPSY